MKITQTRVKQYNSTYKTVISVDEVPVCITRSNKRASDIISYLSGYEVENLRIKAAMYKAYFFRNFSLAEKLQKQSEENRDALIGEFDGFSYASWRANAVYRTLEDMCDEGLLTEKEYRECKV